MGALRSLLFLIFVFFAIWLVRRYLTAQRKPPETKPSRPATAEMRQCTHCGVHAPITSGFVAATGEFYCCEDHWRADHGS